MGNIFGDNTMRKYGMSGFTLMELLITVVILGILVGVGYPQYTRYITETRRSDATINLTRIAALQEKFFTECGRYTPNFNGAIFDPNPALRCTGLGVALTAGSFTTTDGYYTLTIPILVPGPTGVPGGGGYTLSAAPAANQLPDAVKCTTITLRSDGLKGASGSDSSGGNGGRCWKK
jgi:type IV pilus assembly protein PilE